MKESKTIQAVPGSGVVWQAFRAAAPQTVPVFAGYLVLGMGYGIYVQSLGLPVWMPMLMGTVVYGGSLEFALASLLLGRILRIGLRCSSRMGRLVCAGVFAMLAAQIMINVAMCLMVGPSVGVTLPLLSAGGSSVLSAYLGLGLVLSVRHGEKTTMFS